MFFFRPEAGDERFGPDALPGWADFNAGDIFYGFPDLEGRGFKIAHDLHGPPIDPDEGDRTPSPAALAEVRAYMERRFPGLRGAPLSEARVCQYENSANGDLLIDCAPGPCPTSLLVGAGSGHGFKHGPAVGAYAARLRHGHSGRPRTALLARVQGRAAGPGGALKERLMEQPLDTFRSSTWGWLRGTLTGWATMALAVAGLPLTAVAPMEWRYWPLALTAAALLLILWKWFESLAARYDICQDRLIVRRGIFIKSLDEVELYRVKDVRLDFSLINQMAGIGTITVTLERRDHPRRRPRPAPRRTRRRAPRGAAPTSSRMPARSAGSARST